MGETNIPHGPAIHLDSRPEPLRPHTAITEDEQSVTYLGVRLPKAEALSLPKAEAQSPYTPPREAYQGYTDDEFTLALQRDIATSLHSGEPLLVEGGTSIGKTTTIKKMCSELGYEVHYINLNGMTDPEALMGGYKPNPHKTKPEDPEYIFVDGPITSALRQEPGKTKVIVLDEYNGARAEVLLRVHEVIDALERNTTITLSEDASEQVPTNKTHTKLVALTNPPGNGYFGREPLDPAQLRRFVYHKAPSELPRTSFRTGVQSLFGLESALDTTKLTPHPLRPDRLTPSQISEIPGLVEILSRYEEFHSAAKAMVENRSIGSTQPQAFSFDDREEPRRVRDFIAHYYQGDITETMQLALRYFYLNKLESQQDRDRLEQILQLVTYTGPEHSKRQNLPDNNPNNLTNPNSKTGETLTSAEAKAILGERMLDFSGARVTAESIQLGSLPELYRDTIPFSRAELEFARDNGGYLIPQPSLSLATLKAHQDKLRPAGSTEPTFFAQDWYEAGSEAFINEQPNPGWRLIIPEVPSTKGKNYLEQTEAIVDYLRAHPASRLAQTYSSEIAEFNLQEADIKALLEQPAQQGQTQQGWQQAGQKLATLTLTQALRPSTSEALWQMVVLYQQQGTRMHESDYVWTRDSTSASYLVSVGFFDAQGAYVRRVEAVDRNDDLGCSLQLS